VKIAIATDDKTYIAEHFGGSFFVLVATVVNGQVTGKEIREKPGHSQYAGEELHPQTNEKGIHGLSAFAEQRHAVQLDVFKDCEVLIVNMIGTGAHEHFTIAGIKVIATDIKNIDEAIDLYVKGDLRHLEAHVD